VNVSSQGLGSAIQILLERLLRLRAGENLLLYRDQGSDPSMADAIRLHAERIGARIDCLELDDDLALADLARGIAEKIRSGRFDAVCELSTKYFYRTEVSRAVRDVGARVYWLPGLDRTAFIRCLGTVDHERMFAFGVALRGVLREGKRIRVLTDRGTDLRMQIGLARTSRYVARVIGRRRPHVSMPTGLLKASKRFSFLGGQLSFQALADTIEGTAAVDGYLWPPAEIGRLDNPILLVIERGRVVRIGGSGSQPKVLLRWFGEEEISIEHFCIGFHPSAGLSGGIMEAERAFGCISIGMGKGIRHTDGVMTRPTIEMEHGRLEDRGSFTYEKLSRLEQELLQGQPELANNGY